MNLENAKHASDLLHETWQKMLDRGTKGRELSVSSMMLCIIKTMSLLIRDAFFAELINSFH